MKKLIVILAVLMTATVLFADGIGLKSMKASSTLVEKGKSADFYGVANLRDKTAASWVEGVPGDGIGETLTFEFDPPLANASWISVKNGYGDLKYYYDNNRVNDITVTLNDEKTYKTHMRDTWELQTVSIYDTDGYRKSISKVSITIDSVYKGTKYQDTCIAEILFSGEKEGNLFEIDPYMTELSLAYYRDVKKALDVRIGEDGWVEYFKEPTDYDRSMDGPDVQPYWVTWMDSYPENVFVGPYPAPFAVVPTDWTSERDPVYSWNIDIWTYKGGRWVMDNANPLYAGMRNAVEDAKKQGIPMLFYVPDFDWTIEREYFYIMPLSGKQYYFDYTRSLDALDDIEEEEPPDDLFILK